MSTYGIGSIYRVHQIKNNNYTLTNSAKQTFLCEITWICILCSYARYRTLGWMWSWKRLSLLQMVSAK